MMNVVIFFTGIGIGALGYAALTVIRRPPAVLPAATPRAIGRVRRANRADLRLVQRPMRGMDPSDRLPAPAQDFGGDDAA